MSIVTGRVYADKVHENVQLASVSSLKKYISLFYMFSVTVRVDLFSQRIESTHKGVNRIQTHKRFKGTLIYHDIDNTMQIFREIPFFRN